MGLRNSASAPTDVNPSSQTNCIGIGWDASDTNIKLIYNDGSGTATKVDLGVARPTTDRTTSAGVIYQLALSCDPAGSQITWQLDELVAGTTLGSGVISSADIPAATTALAPIMYASVGGTSSIVGVTFVDWYFESQRTA